MESLIINRSEVPELQNIGDIHITQVEKGFLDNKIPFYILNSGDQEVIKVEIVFPSGTVFETSKAVAVTTCQLLDEGTNTQNSKEIAELFEYYGASIEKHTNFDNSSVILYTLNKHLEKTLPLLLEIIKEASFPEKELNSFVSRRKQQLTINLEKVEYVARKEFMKQLYGSNHPYGYETTLLDYDSLSVNDIKSYHKNAFAFDYSKIIVSGKIDDHIIKLINQTLGTNDILSGSSKLSKSNLLGTNTEFENKIHVPKEGAIQSSIRIGKILFNKTHKDYIELSVLNTVLGGYFGSRLMSNIREDKGYTYGIGSGLVSCLESGYFFISTQVGVNVCEDAVKEIYREIEKLKAELIPHEELELVKKYMQGAFVRGIDGPFELAGTFKSLLLYDLDYQFLYNYLTVIQSITPKRLLDLANKYLTDFSETIVGLKPA